MNLRRRHLNEFQLGELDYQLEAIERELSRQREKATQFTSETAKKAVEIRESKKQGRACVEDIRKNCFCIYSYE